MGASPEQIRSGDLDLHVSKMKTLRTHPWDPQRKLDRKGPRQEEESVGSPVPMD